MKLEHVLRSILVLALATMVLAACGEKKDKSESGKAKAGKKAPAKPQPWVVKKLAKMKLTISVPADAKIEETKQDAWNADINNESYSFQMRVVTVTGAYGNFAGEVKDEEKHHSLKFVKWLKKEKTAGGFHLQAEQKNSEGKAHYMIKIRRTIGGKKFQCWQGVEDAKKIPAVVKACMSLKAAK